MIPTPLRHTHTMPPRGGSPRRGDGGWLFRDAGAVTLVDQALYTAFIAVAAALANRQPGDPELIHEDTGMSNGPAD
ncbi:hypothetical protein [Streptomyces sp. NPDC014006]|uniref:hypothetical protein n=1 Tax=Streptomyces sp. NPDC014006 TaxID=3364870 RepID=UPI0036F7D8C9